MPSPPTSFRTGLYFSENGADALPAVVLQTDTPSGGNRDTALLLILHTSGQTTARWAVVLTPSDTPASSLVHYFIE